MPSDPRSLAHAPPRSSSLCAACARVLFVFVYEPSVNRVVKIASVNYVCSLCLWLQFFVYEPSVNRVVNCMCEYICGHGAGLGGGGGCRIYPRGGRAGRSEQLSVY